MSKESRQSRLLKKADANVNGDGQEDGIGRRPQHACGDVREVSNADLEWGGQAEETLTRRGSALYSGTSRRGARSASLCNCRRTSVTLEAKDLAKATLWTAVAAFTGFIAAEPRVKR